MRTYYRHARVVYRRAALLMEHLPAPVSFYRQFRRRRTPIAGTDFLLDQGRIDVQPGAQFNDTAAILRIFSLMATHGYSLSQTAEDRITDALPVLAIRFPRGRICGTRCAKCWSGPHAAHALRTMHALGILEMLIPEFHGIDALVIRDSYHRYTVDEHTFLVIDNMHGAAPARATSTSSGWHNCCRRSTGSISFFLALLLHDTGKGRRNGEHAQPERGAGRQFSGAAGLRCRGARIHPQAHSPAPGDVVRHAARHLRLDNVRGFAEKIGSPQMLKMLTVMTFADIKAVNPDALTPWKAENLWQFYMSTSNFMDRSVDERAITRPSIPRFSIAFVPWFRPRSTSTEAIP